LPFVAGDGAAFAAQGEARADNEGEADPSGEVQGFFDAADDAALGDLEAYPLHRLSEEEAVFGLADGRNGGAQELDAVFVEGALLVEFDGEVQGRLATQGGEHGVGAFAADDLGDRLDVEGFEVGHVSDLGVGHDRGGVGVRQDYSVPLVA
jgi:hypothetical protein